MVPTRADRAGSHRFYDTQVSMAGERRSIARNLKSEALFPVDQLYTTVVKLRTAGAVAGGRKISRQFVRGNLAS